MYFLLGHKFGAGFNGAETSFPQFHVRSFPDYCAGHSKHGAIVRFDMASGFASLLRRIVFDTAHGDEAWLHKLSSIGFSSTDVGVILKLILNYHVDHLSASPPICYDPAPAAYTNTWFSTDFHNGVEFTKQGSMVGMTLADITYGVAFAKIVHNMYTAPLQANLIFRVVLNLWTPL